MEPNHKSYPLDSSAAIHIASINGSYSNFLRLSTELLEQIDGEVLQKNMKFVSLRFPTIAACIVKERTHYVVRSITQQAKKSEETLV